MGRLVAAGACSHILMSPEGVEERARGIVAGIRELGRRIIASKPDLVVVVSSDHMFNVNMSLQAPFCVGVADEYVATWTSRASRGRAIGHSPRPSSPSRRGAASISPRPRSFIRITASPCR